jgi:hypothetical protein
MDWVLEHLRLIIIVGGAIAYWMNQRRKAKEEQETARTLTSTPLAQTQVNDEAARVRRIQEEIRRKIQERAAGGMQKRQPLPEAQAQPTPPPLVPKAQSEPDAYAQSPEGQLAASDREVLEQQQLAAKFKELEEKRREHMGKAEVFAEKTAEGMAASDVAVGGSPLADLRNPTSVRRAIILREVLGPPVGLR